MLFTTFSSMVRHIRKNKVFSLINIFGFTLGIASFILIMLFVFSELSYDRFNEKADRIYRLCIRAMVGDTRINQTYSSARMFLEMTERFPEIEAGVKFLNVEDINVRVGENSISEPRVIFSDSTVFDVFTLPLLAGDPGTVLNRPNTVILSESASRKYFNDVDPVGQNIEMDMPYVGKVQFLVTGTFRNIPVHSHFHTGIIASLVTFPEFLNSKEWTANNFMTYFLLRPGASPGELESKFKDYVIQTFGEKDYETWVSKGNYWEFYLQPLTSIHLRSDLNGEFEPNGNIKYVYIFTIIGFFVLIIASINFMNLATAKSTLRAREVGIKKTVGWTRGQLIGQFLTESVIMTFISLILALVLVMLVLPTYSDWLGRDLTFSLLSSPRAIPLLVVFGLFIGIISGIYPAFFLSSYSPLHVLKVQSVSETKGIGLRNILVILQFAASIFLIIGTLTINRQLFFIQKKDIGFGKKNVLIIRTPSSFSSVLQVFENEMRRHAAVASVAASSSLPGFSFSNIGFGAEGVDKHFTLNLICCEPDFDKVMGFTMIEGRFFSPEFLTDSSGIILNEAAVATLHLTSPIGTGMNDWSDPINHFHVIGVVKDFNYESIHSEIRPMGLLFLNGLRNDPGNYVCTRYSPGNQKEIVSFTEETWEKLMPGIPISYSFMEDDYNKLYQNEKQTRQVFTLLAILAVIVAVMGLLGLASFMAQRKTREIAIRKVFGAGNRQIIRLLTVKFVRWVIVAFIISCPIAWWVMTRWLQNFAYRISLDVWIFILSGAIAIVLAIITVSVISYRAASAFPMASLKGE